MKHVPGDSKWLFHPLVGGHLTPEKGHFESPGSDFPCHVDSWFCTSTRIESWDLKHPNPYPFRIHGTNGMNLPTWMVDFYGFHVGEYTSPMDPSWAISTIIDNRFTKGPWFLGHVIFSNKKTHIASLATWKDIYNQCFYLALARPGNGIALVGQTVKRRVMFEMTFFVGMTSRRIREKLFGNNSPNVTLFGIVFKRHPNSMGELRPPNGG